MLVEASLWFSIVSVRWRLCLRQYLSVTEQRAFFIYWHIFLVWLGVGEKGCHQICLYVFFFAICVSYIVVCVLFCVPVWCKIPLYVFACVNGVLNGLFQMKCQPPQFQRADGSLLCDEPGDFEFCCFFEWRWLWLLLPVLTAVPYVYRA